MADANPAAGSQVGQGRRELILRVCSALVLAPLALAIAYFGGWSFAGFWGLAALAVWWEWTGLVAPESPRLWLVAGSIPIVLALAMMASAQPVAAVLVVTLGMFGLALTAPAGRRGWIAAGVPYAGAIVLAPVLLRDDVGSGFIAIVFLFAIVWATDILAYFIGRAVGGPKLMPQVSPKKTWSGAIGGAVGASAVALAIADIQNVPLTVALALVAAALSIASQCGDLFESFVKRRFGAKDSGRLIPGHGGVMDRLDGFVAAALVAAVIGLWRGGLEHPARGLLWW
jgi:phosphatidate cytidylyltransferase